MDDVKSSRWTEVSGKSSAQQLTDLDTATGVFQQVPLMIITVFYLCVMSFITYLIWIMNAVM